jgi:uncharacterized protein (TIGR00369 family)
MTDIEALRRRMEAIPLFVTFNYRVGELADGEAVVTAPYHKQYDGIFESFHGGLLMTLADSAACAAVLTLAGHDAEVTTTDMNIRFLAPCRTDAVAHARVIKFGKTLCPVAVTLRDTAGREVAVAQVTYMRLGKA